jgi:transposase
MFSLKLEFERGDAEDGSERKRICEEPSAIFVAVLGASSLTFAMASFSQRLPDWIEGQFVPCRTSAEFPRGSPATI